MLTDGLTRETPAPARPVASDGAPVPGRPRRAAERGAAGARGRPPAEWRARPVNGFFDELRRETRRSTRSGAALSLVLYRVDDGPGPAGDGMLEMLHHAKRETDILGHVGDDLLAVLCPDTDADGIHAFARKVGQRLGAPALEVATATFPDPLFHTLSDARGPRSARGLAAAAAAGSPRSAARDPYPLKRALDVAGALCLIVLLSPVLLAAALLVRLGSRGPVIFRQTRLGQGGKPFTFFKFRSMAVDNDDATHRAFVARFVGGDAGMAGTTAEPDPHAGPAGAAAPYKLQRDPRVTRVGAFLRRSSLDELPQLFNVLRGDMSLVGPRPPIPYEIEHYQTWHLRRILTTRPGITGLWQVEGRSRVTFNDMVRMDLRYIRESSLRLDLRILCKTVVVVLRADGAA